MNINLMQGDCLERMKEIPEGSVDIIATDPPYGIAYQSNSRVASDKFAAIALDDNLDWLDGFMTQCDRVLRQDSALYVFCSWHHVETFKRAFSARFTLKNLLVWVKNNHGSGDLRGAYAPKHELVLYGCKGRSVFREKRVPDVLEFPKVPSSRLVHPTEKNTDMLELFVRNSSDLGAVVLDPFMGSGTTGVACVNTGRNFIGIEMDEGYFNIARQRIGEAQGLIAPIPANDNADEASADRPDNVIDLAAEREKRAAIREESANDGTNTL